MNIHPNKVFPCQDFFFFGIISCLNLWVHSKPLKNLDPPRETTTILAFKTATQPHNYSHHTYTTTATQLQPPQPHNYSHHSHTTTATTPTQLQPHNYSHTTTATTATQLQPPQPYNYSHHSHITTATTAT